MPSSSDTALETAPPDAIMQMLRQAMQEHGAGHLDAAEAGYRRVLAEQPQQADALHLLGILESQRGRHDSAAALIAQALRVQPAEAMFHNNLGNVNVERGHLAEAEACYMHALELDPTRLDVLNNLGVLLGHRGDAAGAERVLLKLVELSPDFGDARQNLANLYLRQGRVSDAVQQCFDGLVTAPRNTALRRMLGVAYTSMGMHAEAEAVYRAWLQAEPGNPIAEHHLRACTGEAVPERASDGYVSRVFDAFARSFDAKLAALSYKAPGLVAEAVARHAGAPARALVVLDAGCGTGLCGPLLQPWAQQLAGVDLSEGMLAKAVARQVYDELRCGELVAFLRSRPAAWDLVVSADTLCYFGALEGFAAAAAAALRGPALLVFTVEAHDDADDAPDYRLQSHGRYSHRRRYVEAALRGAGLLPLEVLPVELRMEAQQPVHGWLVTAHMQHVA